MTTPTFPGKFAGASLKRIRRLRNTARTSRHIPRQICRGLIEAAPCGSSLIIARSHIPRQICRGLIEARFRVHYSRRYQFIPRQICRGLIEALERTQNVRVGGRPFPGKFAGASLKPPRRTMISRRASARIPRQICRGLIEARKTSNAHRTSESIPRQICRGLIEAPFAAKWSPTTWTIPRQICRGLIEATRRSDACPYPTGRIPRQICRGLIEAYSPPSDSTTVTAIPRQICRGLIEATWNAPPLAAKATLFPGKFAGASLKPLNAADSTAPGNAHSPANLPGPH